MNLFRELKDSNQIREQHGCLCLTCKRDSLKTLSDLSLCANGDRKYKYVKIPRPSLFKDKLVTGTTLVVTKCPHYKKVKQ